MPCGVVPLIAVLLQACLVRSACYSLGILETKVAMNKVVVALAVRVFVCSLCRFLISMPKRANVKCWAMKYYI